jgi:hypothetical protein
MKKNILIILVAVALLGSSCQDFLSVDEVNPNTASAVAPKFLLPAAIKNVAATMGNPRRFDFVYLWHGLWSISAGYSQPQNLVQYKLLNSNYENAFKEFYYAGNNLDIIEKASTDPKDANYAALAKIMKAFIFQNLVDCWGDVPYFDAFQAPKILKPTYTKQKAIYEDLVIQLDAAIALIQNAPSDAAAIPGSSDIIYGGDLGKWLKFANTLKLRILVCQSGMTGRETYIKDNIATTASIGYLGAGEGVLVNPGFVVSEGKMNPFYEYFYNASGTSNSDGVTYYFAGKDAVDFYSTTNDLRLAKFFNSYTTPPAAPAYDGNIFGTLPDGLTPAAQTSKLGYAVDDAGTMIGTATKSAPLLPDFESLFLQAEAVQRGLITGDAKALYESAVIQSYLYMGLTSGNAINYLGQEFASVNFDVSSNKLELILTQKWASLNGIAPVTIWSDYRRTGYPSGLHFSVDPAKENDTPPVRLLYPQDEINVNNANVVAEGDINAFTSKIFWQNR